MRKFIAWGFAAAIAATIVTGTATASPSPTDGDHHHPHSAPVNPAPGAVEPAPQQTPRGSFGGDHNAAPTTGGRMVLIPGVPCNYSAVYDDCQ